MVVSAFDMHFFQKGADLHIKISCHARRMQHMVVLLVPSGATKYVQKWDPIMTKFLGQFWYISYIFIDAFRNAILSKFKMCKKVKSAP